MKNNNLMNNPSSSDSVAITYKEYPVEIVRDFKLRIDIDQILICQGAQPEAIRQRRPDIISLTQEALDREWSLVDPVLMYRYYDVKAFNDGILHLAGGGTLHGPVITQNLAVAEAVVVMIGTVGPAIDRRISESFPRKPSYALAVDGVGTAAADALRRAAQSRFKSMADSRGWRLSRSLCPGIVGWELREGQKQIFSLLEGAKIGVKLLESGQMNPQKSLSCVLGMGVRVEIPTGPPCQFCASRKTCIFQDRHKEQSLIQH